MGVLRDLWSWVLSQPDEDLLSGEHNADSRHERSNREVPIRVDEAHEVETRQVAGGVVEADKFGAGIRRVVASRVGTRVPHIARRVELKARVATLPRRLCDLAQEPVSLDCLDHTSVDTRRELPLFAREGLLH